MSLFDLNMTMEESQAHNACMHYRIEHGQLQIFILPTNPQTLLIIKSLDHLYQKDQNIGNKTLSTGTLTKES